MDCLSLPLEIVIMWFSGKEGKCCQFQPKIRVGPLYASYSSSLQFDVYLINYRYAD